MLPRRSWCPEPLAGGGGGRDRPLPGGLISQALFCGCQLPSGSFSFLLSTGPGLCLIGGGVPPGARLPFSGSPPRPPGRTPGHAAAQRARPVHSAAAARPADPESEGNGRPWGHGLPPHSHPAAPRHSISNTACTHQRVVHRQWGCGPSDCVHGARPVAGAQDSGSDSVKAEAAQGSRGASHPHPLKHTHTHTQHTHTLRTHSLPCLV